MTWDDFCYKLWQKYVQNNIFQCPSALKALVDLVVFSDISIWINDFCVCMESLNNRKFGILKLALCDMFVWRAVFCAQPLARLLVDQVFRFFCVTRLCNDWRWFSLQTLAKIHPKQHFSVSICVESSVWHCRVTCCLLRPASSLVGKSSSCPWLFCVTCMSLVTSEDFRCLFRLSNSTQEQVESA